MTNKVYQVPYGTKDILPGEMKTRRGIENAIINVFDKWGYDEVKTPDFEYVDTGYKPQMALPIKAGAHKATVTALFSKRTDTAHK